MYEAAIDPAPDRVSIALKKDGTALLHKHCAMRGRDSSALADFVEKSFAEGEYQAHQCAEEKRKNYFKDRLNENGNNADLAAGDKCLCNAEGDGEYHKSHRIVKSDDGEKYFGKRSLCLILLDDHKGCRRCGCGRYSAEGYRCRQGKYLFTQYKMQSDESNVYEDSGYNSLHHADNRCLLSDLF